MKYYNVSSKKQTEDATYIGASLEDIARIVGVELKHGAVEINIKFNPDYVKLSDVITIPRDQYEEL